MWIYTDFKERIRRRAGFAERKVLKRILKEKLFQKVFLKWPKALNKGYRFIRVQSFPRGGNALMLNVRTGFRRGDIVEFGKSEWMCAGVTENETVASGRPLQGEGFPEFRA
jgi:hypothetical protein